MFHSAPRTSTIRSAAGPSSEPPTYRLEQRFNLIHAPQPCVHVNQFAKRAVHEGQRFSIGGVFGKSPGLTPYLNRQRVMRRVVILEAQTGEQRRGPRRVGMLV